METNNLTAKIVALTLGIMIFAMVLVPIVNDCVGQQTTVYKTANNSAPSTYYELTNETITITLDATDGVAVSSGTLTGVTTIVTTAFKIVVTDSTTDSVAVLTSTGSTTYSTTDSSVDMTFTINSNAGTASFEGTASSASVDIDKTFDKTMVLYNKLNGSWGNYTPSAQSPIYVYKDQPVIVATSSTIVSEKVTDTTQSVALTSSEYAQHTGAYGITGVASSGTIYAPIQYTWTESAAMMDSNVQAIVKIIPIMVVVGIILGAVGLMAFKREGY